MKSNKVNYLQNYELSDRSTKHEIIKINVFAKGSR